MIKVMIANKIHENFDSIDHVEDLFHKLFSLKGRVFSAISAILGSNFEPVFLGILRQFMVSPIF